MLDLLPLLSTPPTALPYAVHLSLSRVFPGRSLLETEDADFDLEGFARAGHATLTVRPDLSAQLAWYWDSAKQSEVAALDAALCDVDFEGARITALVLRWREDGCSRRRTFLVSEALASARALFRAVCSWSSTHVGAEIFVFEDGDFRRDAELFEALRGAHLGELVLAPQVRRAIEEDVLGFFDARPLYERHRVPHKRGVLFVGPPGNGKTHALKACLAALGRPTLYVRGLKARWDHDHNCIARIFQRARELAPCVLVLEDLDALVSDDNRSVFLNELDGLARNQGILTLATTNHPQRLDPALTHRPSRFDRKIAFELPDQAARRAYLGAWSRALEDGHRPDDAALDGIAELTGGFSYAYLKELGLAAILAWMRHGGTLEDALVRETDSLSSQVRVGP